MNLKEMSKIIQIQAYSGYFSLQKQVSGRSWGKLGLRLASSGPSELSSSRHLRREAIVAACLVSKSVYDEARPGFRRCEAHGTMKSIQKEFLGVLKSIRNPRIGCFLKPKAARNVTLNCC